MASGNGVTDVAFKGSNVLPSISPSSLTGNTAKYESVGGKRRSNKVIKAGKKNEQKGGSSVLAFSELAQQKPLLAPLPNVSNVTHKQAGGKKRSSSKKYRGSKKTMKNMISGIFKLFKNKK